MTLVLELFRTLVRTIDVISSIKTLAPLIYLPPDNLMASTSRHNWLAFRLISSIVSSVSWYRVWPASTFNWRSCWRGRWRLILWHGQIKWVLWTVRNRTSICLFWHFNVLTSSWVTRSCSSSTRTRSVTSMFSLFFRLLDSLLMRSSDSASWLLSPLISDVSSRLCGFMCELCVNWCKIRCWFRTVLRKSGGHRNMCKQEITVSLRRLFMIYI